jgi:hypothetical protein
MNQWRKRNKTEYTNQDLLSSQKLCDSKKILGRMFTKQNLESKEVSRTAGRESQAPKPGRNPDLQTGRRGKGGGGSEYGTKRRGTETRRGGVAEKFPA